MYTTDGTIIVGEIREKGAVVDPGKRVSYRGIADETKTHYYELRVMETGEVYTLVDRDIYNATRPCLINSPTLKKLQEAYKLIGKDAFLRRDSESYWQIKNSLDALNNE